MALHEPEQQSAPTKHGPPPAGRQHFSEVQSAAALPAQHSLSKRQRWPRALHAQLTPLVQVPLQHSLSASQAVLRMRQHDPVTQNELVQHSVLLPQATPGALQQLMSQESPAQHGCPSAQRLPIPSQQSLFSQLPEQHWLGAAQVCPGAWQHFVLSHRDEQQSLKEPQVSPGPRQAPHWLTVLRQTRPPQQLELNGPEHVCPVALQHAPPPVHPPPQQSVGSAQSTPLLWHTG